MLQFAIESPPSAIERETTFKTGEVGKEVVHVESANQGPLAHELLFVCVGVTLLHFLIDYP
jgi:hypothetical protein